RFADRRTRDPARGCCRRRRVPALPPMLAADRRRLASPGREQAPTLTLRRAPPPPPATRALQKPRAHDEPDSGPVRCAGMQTGGEGADAADGAKAGGLVG